MQSVSSWIFGHVMSEACRTIPGSSANLPRISSQLLSCLAYSTSAGTISAARLCLISNLRLGCFSDSFFGFVDSFCQLDVPSLRRAFSSWRFFFACFASLASCFCSARRALSALSSRSFSSRASFRAFRGCVLLWCSRARSSAVDSSCLRELLPDAVFDCVLVVDCVSVVDCVFGGQNRTIYAVQLNAPRA